MLAVVAIEVTKANKIRVKAYYTLLNLLPGDFSSYDGLIEVVLIGRTAINICTSSDAIRGCYRLVRGVHVRVIDVVCCITIGGDVAFGRIKCPRIAEKCLQEKGVCTAWESIDCIVRAHDTVHFCISCSGQELRCVELGKVLLRDHCIITQPRYVVVVFQIVPGKVFCSGNYLEVFRLNASLHPCNVLIRILRDYEEIFTWRLLATSPQWTSKCIDVRSVAVKAVLACVTERTSLSRYQSPDLIYQCTVH